VSVVLDPHELSPGRPKLAANGVGDRSGSEALCFPNNPLHFAEIIDNLYDRMRVHPAYRDDQDTKFRVEQEPHEGAPRDSAKVEWDCDLFGAPSTLVHEQPRVFTGRGRIAVVPGAVDAVAR
jgi:hypothetical protein